MMEDHPSITLRPQQKKAAVDHVPWLFAFFSRPG